MPPIEGAAAPTSIVTPSANVTTQSVGRSDPCGHVMPGQPGAPRVGPLEWLRRAFGTVVRCFSPAAPGEARLPGRRQPDPGAKSLGAFINDVVLAVNARDASSDAIVAALLGAETAAHRWWLGGGSPREVIAETARSLENVPTQQLLQLAHAFGSTAVADAQQATRLHAGAQHLLMALESAVNSELVRRIPTTVDAGLRKARASLRAGAPSARITQALRSAFESAAPLLKAGVPGLLSAEGDPLSEVNRIVLERLGRLPQQELPELLRYARSEDLDKLRQLAAPPPLEGADAAIETEIRLRPARLAGALHRRTERFCERNAAATRIDPHAFVNEIAELGAELSALRRQIDGHCRLHGVENPPEITSRLEQTQARLGERVESLLQPGRVDPRDFSTRQLVRLTNALHALGLRELADAALGDAQQVRLEEQRELFRQRVADVTSSAPVAELSPQFLRDLNRLEDAALALEEAMQAFDREAPPAASAAPPDADIARARAQQAQGDLITECLQLTPDAAGVLSRPALTSALHTGAELAFQADETRVGERFARMARLCEQIAGAGAAGTPDGATPERIASHREFAATQLLPEERVALRDAFALHVPPDAPPTLQPTGFKALQPHADVFPKQYPPPTAADVKTAPPGAMLDDVLSYCQSIPGAEDLVQALRALHDFTRTPTPENGAAVTRACATVPRTLVPRTPEDPLVPDSAAQALIEYSPSFPLPHDLFDGLERRLTEAVETHLLPGMIEAIHDGQL